MTYVYITDCSRLSDSAIIQQLLPRFDRHRQHKIRTLQSICKQAQTAAAGLLLEFCFGPKVPISLTEKGKPYLTDHSSYFSISHTGIWVALAVSDIEIGLDIEEVSPIRPSVLRRCFTAEEQQWIANDAARFTQLWTKKEAYGKLSGCGITAPLDRPVPNDIAYYSTQFGNVILTVCGDVTPTIVPINIKDLL